MRSVLILMAVACLAQWPLAAATAEAQASCSGWNTKAFFVPAGVADVSRCLKAGAEVNARDKFGRTPLHWAATYSNSQAVVTALLKAGAEVNARGRKKGLMPIHAAAYSRLPQIVTVLAQAGADVNAGMEDGTTALHVAAWFSQTPAVVTALLDAGPKSTRVVNLAAPRCTSRLNTVELLESSTPCWMVEPTRRQETRRVKRRWTWYPSTPHSTARLSTAGCRCSDSPNALAGQRS